MYLLEIGILWYSSISLMDAKLLNKNFFPNHHRYSLFTYVTHPSPSYGGVNSGLMLMNLDGLRKSPWTRAILTINEELAPFNVYGDQVTYYPQPSTFFVWIHLS